MAKCHLKIRELDQALNIIDKGLKIDKVNKELIQCKLDIIYQFEIVTLQDGSKYKGEFKDGKKNGQGIL